MVGMECVFFCRWLVRRAGPDPYIQDLYEACREMRLNGRVYPRKRHPRENAVDPNLWGRTMIQLWDASGTCVHPTIHTSAWGACALARGLVMSAGLLV